MIVDDDKAARDLLGQFCRKTSSLELVASCDSVAEALRVLEEQSVDLIFLDVEMPEANGFELIERMPVLPLIIFTTAKADYAFDAFQFEAVDYLKKPISYPRFLKAVEKALRLADAPENGAPSPTPTRDIYIKEKGRLIRIPLRDILYFENVADYVRIKTNNGQHLIYSTLKSIDKKLPPELFVRVHRSYIVNLEKIVDIEENTLVIDRTVIPIGKAHRANLMSRLYTL